MSEKPFRNRLSNEPHGSKPAADFLPVIADYFDDVYRQRLVRLATRYLQERSLDEYSEATVADIAQESYLTAVEYLRKYPEKIINSVDNLFYTIVFCRTNDFGYVSV